MEQRFDIAIIGADTPIASALLELLAERRLPLGELSVLAVDPDAAQSVEFMGQAQPLDNAREFNFAQVQLAFLAGDDQPLRSEAQRAADAGCVVIDATGAAWPEAAIPRVIAAVNPTALEGFNECGIVASAERVLVPLLRALAPLHRRHPLQALHVTVQVPVSDSGLPAFQDLAQETTALLNARYITRRHFAQQIAFNTHGQIGDAGADGLTARERQALTDARALLGQPELPMAITLVQSGIFYGYAMQVECRAQGLDVAAARALLGGIEGVEMIESSAAAECPSPVTDATASLAVRVARLRRGAHPDSVAFWLTADNLRVAAAENAIHCAAILIRQHL